MKYSYKLIPKTLILFCLLSACSADEITDERIAPEGNAVEITGAIQAGTAETKAVMNPDQVSYKSFETGDHIGFFSTVGIVADNMRLEAQSSPNKFKPASGEEFKWQTGAAKNVFAYYPYDGNWSQSDPAINIWDTVNNRFHDILLAKRGIINNGATVTLDFYHQFALVAVVRGSGFENKTDDITINLSKKIADRAKLENQKLELSEDAVAGRDELTAIQHMDNNYYAIIPTGKIGAESIKATTLTLTANNDATHTVPIALPAKNKGIFEAGKKYTITVEMLGNRVVVNLTSIDPWEVISDSPGVVEQYATEKGIKSVADFKAWLADPNGNTYKNDDGDNAVRLFVELDLNGETLPVLAVAFNGIFDGYGNTIRNFKMNGSANTGLFSILSGTVKNLIIEDATVAGTGDNIGIFAGSLTGHILNCRIRGNSSVSGSNYVGGAVGKMDASATITTFYSTASVSGSGLNVDLLVGNYAEIESRLTNCNSNGALNP